MSLETAVLKMADRLGDARADAVLAAYVYGMESPQYRRAAQVSRWRRVALCRLVAAIPDVRGSGR